MSCGRIKTPIHALRGLHGPADVGNWPWDSTAFGIIRTAKIQAVQVITGEDIDHRAINGLRSTGIQFIKARVFGKIYKGQYKSGVQFVQEQEESIAKLYATGVEYFTLFNEPNLYSQVDQNGPQEGFGTSWNSGAEFAEQFVEAVNYLTSKFPAARWGFPAISPGHVVEGLRADPDQFLQEAHKAIIKADFIGCHSYWGYGKTELDLLNEIKAFANKYNKLVFCTEFSNVDPIEITSKETKGHQYANFYRLSKYLPKNIGALFSYVLSASSGFESETWRGSPIPEIVGAS